MTISGKLDEAKAGEWHEVLSVLCALGHEVGEAVAMGDDPHRLRVPIDGLLCNLAEAQAVCREH